MGVRGSLFAALLGVVLAVVVLKANDPGTPAASRSGHDYIGHTSDGVDLIADAYGPYELQISVSSTSGSCSPDGGVPAGVVTVPVRFADGKGRRTGSFWTPVTFQGRRVPRMIQFEIDAGWSGDHLAGRLTRVDRFAGRTCVREATFTASKG